jgi:hypothetical protein
MTMRMSAAGGGGAVKLQAKTAMRWWGHWGGRARAGKRLVVHQIRLLVEGDDDDAAAVCTSRVRADSRLTNEPGRRVQTDSC